MAAIFQRVIFLDGNKRTVHFFKRKEAKGQRSKDFLLPLKEKSIIFQARDSYFRRKNISTGLPLLAVKLSTKSVRVIDAMRNGRSAGVSGQIMVLSFTVKLVLSFLPKALRVILPLANSKSVSLLAGKAAGLPSIFMPTASHLPSSKRSIDKEIPVGTYFLVGVVAAVLPPLQAAKQSALQSKPTMAMRKDGIFNRNILIIN